MSFFVSLSETFGPDVLTNFSGYFFYIKYNKIIILLRTSLCFFELNRSRVCNLYQACCHEKEIGFNLTFFGLI
jgi:hypothetical protein